MNAKKQGATEAGELSTGVSEGTRRLHLSITRMKKLRSGVTGGIEQDQTEPGSPGGRSWM